MTAGHRGNVRKVQRAVDADVLKQGTKNVFINDYRHWTPLLKINECGFEQICNPFSVLTQKQKLCDETNSQGDLKSDSSRMRTGAKLINL